MQSKSAANVELSPDEWRVRYRDVARKTAKAALGQFCVQVERNAAVCDGYLIELGDDEDLDLGAWVRAYVYVGPRDVAPLPYQPPTPVPASVAGESAVARPDTLDYQWTAHDFQATCLTAGEIRRARAEEQRLFAIARDAAAAALAARVEELEQSVAFWKSEQRRDSTLLAAAEKDRDGYNQQQGEFRGMYAMEKERADAAESASAALKSENERLRAELEVEQAAYKGACDNRSELIERAKRDDAKIYELAAERTRAESARDAAVVKLTDVEARYAKCDAVRIRLAKRVEELENSCARTEHALSELRSKSSAPGTGALADKSGTFFDVFRRLNVQRSREAFGHELHDWTPLEWAGAICGEAGELSNVAKKLRRGLSTDPKQAACEAMMADEMADVFCYLDLLAARQRIDLRAAIMAKFDRISDEKNWDGPRLTALSSPSSGGGRR